MRRLLRAPGSPVRSDPLSLHDLRGPRALVVRVLGAEGARIGFAGALLAAHQLGELTVPVLLGLAIDEGVAAGDPARLALWIGALVVVFLLLATAYRVGIQLGLDGLERSQHRLRLATVFRLLDPRGIRDSRPAGQVLSMISGDVTQVSRGVLIAVFPVAELTAVVYGGILLVTLAGPIGLALIAGGLVTLIVTDRLSRSLRRRAEAEQEAVAVAAGVAADSITGERTVRALGAGAQVAATYRAVNDRALTAARSARTAEAVFEGGSRLASGVFVVLVGLAVAVVAVSGGLEVGAFIAVVGVLQLVLAPLEALATNLGHVWASAVASARRVFMLIAAEPERAEAAYGAAAPPALGPRDAPKTKRHDLSLEGLVLRGGSDPMTVTVSEGSLVAVVADRDDAALLREIISGRRAPSQGRILVGRCDLAQQRSEQLPTLIIAPPPRAAVVGAVDERLRNALGVPDRATEHLSGGERQRLALAEALGTVAPVLVLHDPTTAVDAVTEHRIASRLRSLTEGRAVVLLTLSPALLDVADLVLVMQRGSVVASGHHRDLIRDARYAELIA